MDTAVVTNFADGQYRFWLPLPQVFELERNCETSLLAIEERLRAGIGQDAEGRAVFLGGGDARVKEIRETIRLALIGGNHAVIDGEQQDVGPIRAKELVDSYTFPSRPLAESAALAWDILSASIFGIRLKKKDAGVAETIPSPSEKAN